MAVVRCPECRKPARVPDADRTLTVQCPHCRHAYEAPPSAPAEVDAVEVLPDEPPPLPRRRAAATQPQVELPDDPPPRRRRDPEPQPHPAPQAGGSPFDFDGGGGLVKETGVRQRQAATSAGGWLMAAAFLGGVPVLQAGISVLVAAFAADRLPLEARMPVLVGGGLVFVFGLVFVVPVVLGSRAVSNSSSFGLAMTGAVCALLMGAFYGLSLLPTLMMVAQGQVCVALIFALPAFIGLVCIVAGIKTILALWSGKGRERFAASDRRRDEEEDDRPRRRRRDEYEEDDRRPARRRDRDY